MSEQQQNHQQHRVIDEVEDARTFLELEALASAPYASFVYEDEAEARATSRKLFEEGVAEFSPPYAHCVVSGSEGETLAGMFAGPLSASELSRARLRATRIVMRAVKPATIERMKLAGQTLLKLEANDQYLSRIAVHPSHHRQGIGLFALRKFLELAKERGGKRAVLEVGADATAARALYASVGFNPLGEHRVKDPLSSRALTYHHMGKVL